MILLSAVAGILVLCILGIAIIVFIRKQNPYQEHQEQQQERQPLLRDTGSSSENVLERASVLIKLSS